MPEKRRQKHQRVEVYGHHTVISLDLERTKAGRDNNPLALWVIFVFLDK
jgi:hypothetical protein